jgi:hypothetical protein
MIWESFYWRVDLLKQVGGFSQARAVENRHVVSHLVGTKV